MVEETARLSQLYGLGIVLSVMIAIAFFWLVWYVLKTTHQRELSLVQLTTTYLAHLHELVLQHDQRAIEAIKAMSEASLHQREEHKEMIALLRDLNHRT